MMKKLNLRIFYLNKDGNNDNISDRNAIQMCRNSGANDNTIKKYQMF